MRNTTIILTLLLGLFAGGCSSRTLTPESAPDSPGRYPLSIKVDGLERSFIVHLPAAYDGKKPLPVVVMLHGGGGNAKATNWETGWTDKADQAGFIAVFPNAAARNPNRRSSFALNPQLWNDGSDRFYPDQTVVNDVRFLEALLDTLAASFAVNERRVYLTGFSNGASMSFLAAAKVPHRIAAIAPVAGACWIDPGALQPAVSMLYITGSDDPLNLIEGGSPRLANGNSDAVRSKPKPPVRESILKWVKALGLSERSRLLEQENGVTREVFGDRDVEVVYIRVEGLGHTWAGGRSILPASMVGASSDKINATNVIWDFFQRHAR
ncbi:MAG: hypothetical protein CMK89_21065 [Pseudomonadales bacterium]|nr:hypothetical protein [Pseudomonadales bacterium]